MLIIVSLHFTKSKELNRSESYIFKKVSCPTLKDEASSLSEYGALESISLNKIFLITKSFIFDNDVKDLFDVGTIFLLIAFVVDLIMESEVWSQ